MLNKIQNAWRSSIIFTLFVAMMAGLFGSRALLSVAMISFVVFSFLHPGIKQQFRQFISTPLLWGMSLLFLLPLLSGAWSGDQEKWMDILRIKLPLLLLPLAFAAPFGFSRRHWDVLAFIFILLLLLATGWSMFHYLTDMAAVHEAYLQAKTMQTPLGNDHVRFSWLVAVAVMLAGWMGTHQWKINKRIAWLLLIICAWFIFFLHILAARTGLISFYIMLAGLAAWLVLAKAKPARAAMLVGLIILLPVAAYLALPSFRNRVRYIRYDFSYFRNASYLPGANDAVRVISLHTGWTVLQQHPLTGVGFGDITSAMNEEYKKNYPGMIEADRILPSSEWLMYGAGCGWPGFLVFTGVMLLPFFSRAREGLPWYLLNATAAFSLLFDIGLEVQYGVFAYSFIILWCRKWMVTEKI